MAKTDMTHKLSTEEFNRLCNELDISLPVSNDISCLGDSLTIGPLTTPNRFVALPMEGCDAESDGSPGALTFRRYERIATGGAGIIWLEACAVTPEGRSKPNSLFLQDSNIEHFRELVNRIRQSARESLQHEVICILQITHSGRYSRPTGNAEPVMVRRCPELDAAEGLSDDFPLASDDLLVSIQDAFLKTASLAEAAGFDGVDIKSCHGYLISSLLGAHEREGKYGGSYENRTRFLKEIIRRIQTEIPSLLVTTRLNIFDGVSYPYGFGRSQDGSPDMREPLRLIGELADMGLPLLSISLGFPRYNPYLTRPHKGAKQEHPIEGIARFSDLTAQAQSAAADIPVVTAGLAWLDGLFPQVAAGLIRNGTTKLIGQGRNSLAYPDSVRDILEEGVFSKNKACITCSGCSKLLGKGKPVGCIVRDRDFYSLK